MLVVSALQNTAYTGNYCLALMNEKKGKYETVEVMLFCFRPTMKWSASFETLQVSFHGKPCFATSI